jgi:hypothetical protein
MHWAHQLIQSDQVPAEPTSGRPAASCAAEYLFHPLLRKTEKGDSDAT